VKRAQYPVRVINRRPHNESQPTRTYQRAPAEARGCGTRITAIDWWLSSGNTRNATRNERPSARKRRLTRHTQKLACLRWPLFCPQTALMRPQSNSRAWLIITTCHKGTGAPREHCEPTAYRWGPRIPHRWFFAKTCAPSSPQRKSVNSSVVAFS
jgi:hypothetical protein